MKFLKYVHEIYLIFVLKSDNNVVVDIIKKMSKRSKREVDLDPDFSEDHSSIIQNSKCHTAVSIIFYMKIHVCRNIQ